MRPVLACVLSLYKVRSLRRYTLAMASFTSSAKFLEARESIIREIYVSNPPNKFVVCTTGGGSHIANYLLSTAGASNSVLDIQIPYSRESLCEYFYNNSVDYSSTSCDSSTVSMMALASYRRASSIICSRIGKELTSAEVASMNIFGVGCTASIASAEPKKGSHRCFVALCNGEKTILYSVELAKGFRSRLEEDQLCSKLILDAISSFSIGSCVQHTSDKSNSLNSDESLQCSEIASIDSCITDVVSGKLSHCLYLVDSDGNQRSLPAAKVPENSIIYPGSFNPLHEGHTNMVRACIDKLGTLAKDVFVIFEMSISNADKGKVTEEEILKRLSQFTNSNSLLNGAGILNFGVCLTGEPLFYGKAKLFPGSIILIGADTFVRLVDRKYYGDALENNLALVEDEVDRRKEMNMVRSLSFIADQKCRFIVGGRFNSGEFQTLSTLKSTLEIFRTLPETVRSLFVELTEEEFRNDISSTEIRKKLSNSCKN